MNFRKHPFKFIVFGLIAGNLLACDNSSLFNGAKTDSPYVDSLKFADPTIEATATDVDNFTKEEIKADKEMNSYSATEKETVINRLRKEGASLEAEVDSTSRKVVSAMGTKPAAGRASVDAAGIKEYGKWVQFLKTEGGKIDRLKNKVLRF